MEEEAAADKGKAGRDGEDEKEKRKKKHATNTQHAHRVVGWVGACSLPHAHAAPNACPSSPSLVILTCARVF
ncbi:hypothetical protein niasHS_001409 [Heterodera schachtii]|uniref:Uncharacterized protein n=1 Tax=Heterodera schachtii TaxID=97005 RepID=A0ABD2KDD3_HETSC